jgi:hypothetical protein
VSWYVRRTFQNGVTSCGGPWGSEEQARYMASHVGPANGMGVAVIAERDDPIATDERPLLLESHHRGFPGLRVTIGPFRDRHELSAFLAAALGANFRGLPMAEVTDWHLVMLDGEQQRAWPSPAGSPPDAGR